MVALHRNGDGEILREGDDIRNLPLEGSDTLVAHTSWIAISMFDFGNVKKKATEAAFFLTI